MQRLTRAVLRHKRIVASSWLLLTLVGIAASGPASKALDQRFSVPGREGWTASQAIVERFGNGGDSPPLVPVVRLPAGTSASAARTALRRVEDVTRRTLPGARVAGYGSTGDATFTSEDGRVAFVYAFLPPAENQFVGHVDAQRDLRAALRDVRVAGAPVLLTGYDALNDASGEGAKGRGVLLEAVIGGIGALVVLIFVFGSALALVPIAMAISCILVSFLLLWALTAVTDVSPIVQFLVALIGLGISIDYALLIVVRWREERDRGLEGDEAVAAALGTAGRAVVFSGTTVAVGLLALVALPLPFLRSMGYGGLLIPLVATLAAITLLPVVLATVGPRLDRRRIRRGERSTRLWLRWSEGVVRRRGLAATAAVAILAVLAAPAFGLHLGNANPDTIAKTGAAKDGLTMLEDSGVGEGAIMPIETLVAEGDAAAVAAAQRETDGMHGAVAPTGDDWRRAGSAVVVAAPRGIDDSQAGRDAIQAVRDAAHGASPSARVGGMLPVNADFTDAVYGAFPQMLLLISLITFCLLARAFRSLVLPAKAIILNVISIGAAWGVMTFVWQSGHGSEALWGIGAAGSIAPWIPLMVFAFLYGLSMDYEVFILARMREEYDTSHDTDTAVVFGLARTGRLVTSAALILFLAFAAMASGPQTDVKILATGLAAGIVVDATIVRALLVPAAVSLFGRWNWWFPAPAARLLRTERAGEPAPARR